MKELQVGLRGVGRWGKNIERTLRTLEGVSVRVLERGELPEDLDGVLIATPSGSHASVALPFIEKGIATFIEKPMTTSIKDAEAIRDAAKRSGALIFVGHIYLYNPAFWKLLELLPLIGAITRVEIESTSDTPRPEGSVLWDWLPHHLAMARMIFVGDAESVVVESEGARTTKDAALVTFRFKDAELVSRISWVASEKRRLLTVTGEKGAILFDEKAEKKITLRVGESTLFPEYENTLPLTNELSAFIECLRTGKTDRPHLDESLAIVAMIAAAEAAAQEPGKRVTIQR